MIALQQMLVPTYLQLLGALAAWLNKAASQFPGEAADRLLAARLAPDMFPLATQVRFSCVQAQEAMFRLSGQPFPPSLTELLQEARDAVQNPGTIADALARIAQTIAIVESVAEQLPIIDPGAPIAHALPQGMIFDLSAESYARDWALPQFYFHLMTAYAILRAEGVSLGKADYVAHLFPYLRPGTGGPAR